MRACASCSSFSRDSCARRRVRSTTGGHKPPEPERAPAAQPHIFRDCERGALPIVGDAFGLRTAFDDELLHVDDVYF